MNNLLVVIPMCADDAPMAERLLDWIYQINGREAQGHVLLAYAHDVHAEMKTKLRICAELAFDGMTEFQATGISMAFNGQKPIELKTKTEFTNNLFNQTAHFIAGHFRWPWLWCEPDCVPLSADWIEKLSEAYNSQPKKFMARRMKRMVGTSENFFMSRTGIYPTSAYNELRGFVGTPPLEWAAGPHISPRATSTKLIQQINYDGDFSKVDSGAVLLHCDKTGKLIEQLRERGIRKVPEHQNGESVAIRMEIPEKSEAPMPEDNLRYDPMPLDKRTKEYREWKKRQKVAL